MDHLLSPTHSLTHSLTYLLRKDGRKPLGVIQKVRSLKRGEVIEKRTKRTVGGRSQHLCACTFLKKNADIFKMKLYILQFFLLIIMKIYFSACFYFAQLFVLFSAPSIVFFAHFRQKWLFIQWL